MAVRSLEKVLPPNAISGVLIFKWSGLQNGDSGSPIVLPEYADKSVHIKGTWGSGGTLVIEGSNDVTSPDYITLNDPQGEPLTFTSDKIEAVLENVYQFRPRVTAGDGTTNLTVTVLIQTTR